MQQANINVAHDSERLSSHNPAQLSLPTGPLGVVRGGRRERTDEDKASYMVSGLSMVRAGRARGHRAVYERLPCLAMPAYPRDGSHIRLTAPPLRSTAKSRRGPFVGYFSNLRRTG